MKNIYFVLLLIPFFTSAQVVDEIIQIDTTFETLKVVYKPEITSSYYFKKVAVFADDTSKIAIEKSYTNYGQNGVYKVYYPNGRLKIKTVFANNKIYGEWTYYDENGLIIIKGLYRDGTKHGFWAYKSLMIYGRYKNGYKNKRWKRIDESENKYISHYKMGELKSGEGFGDEIPFYLSTPRKADVNRDTNQLLSNIRDTISIEKEYEQAISFITKNVMFRKSLKKHFGSSIRKSLGVKKAFDKNERFKFILSPEIKALKITKFFKESEEGLILVASIDTVLKEKATDLKQLFSGETIKKDKNLFNNSTDKESLMVITFSEVKMNLLRLDIDWTFKEEKSKFRILLYFDNNDVLKGAEYEKP
tara:strand:+ start:1538 stop:2620 length:1083 start_codon:yes stop_codon:yes gene_type:complete